MSGPRSSLKPPFSAGYASRVATRLFHPSRLMPATDLVGTGRCVQRHGAGTSMGSRLF
eukprot:CAMPEP_0117590996 /NCGR_PEP_ID=MMETSP0784-20121206/71283_1 /TAXON_ID=39447 /ORGANISM="" /LENGTH=57 /DNA_ID=CAMNT_0005392661 /DNA_START=53 /DNA_END=223 /DNA_ORIENTATION=-